MYGAILFVLSAAFTGYLAFKGQISEKSWVSLLWILMIFSSLYAASQTFYKESEKEYYLFYSLVSPTQLLLGKLGFQLIFQLIITLLGFGVLYGLFAPNLQHVGHFLLLIILSSLNFTALLTVMAGIASRAGKSSTLLSILCLPLLYPILILGMQTAEVLLLKEEIPTIVYKYLGLKLAIFALISSLGFVLFPYLWRD